MLVLAVAILSVALWMIVPSRFEENTNPAKAAELSKAAADHPEVSTSKDAAGGISHEVKAEDELPSKIEDVWKRMTTDPSHAKALLVALEQQLQKASPEEAARVIQDFLNLRKNAETRLGFSVTDGGALAAAPTLRVWLLDQLGRLNPDAAADYARQILTTPESADEWAVAMRNFARVRTSRADTVFLKTKARELLGDPRWQQEQSAGWLEAFDVVVHARATELAPDLSRLLVRTEDSARPSAHAAYLTLDRLVLAEPAAMLETLAAAPDLMKGREQTRANYFARADVRDAKQRAIVERYLLDAARPAQELETFAGLYPSANMMVSKNLLTPTETFSRDDLVARDREALRVVDQWAGDPRFERLRPQIQKIRDRLSVFVQQAGK